MFITILSIDMSPLNLLHNNRIYYIRWPKNVKENLRPPHTLSVNKTVNTVIREAIQRTYLAILYLQNTLQYHSLRENVFPFIPMKKLLPPFFRISRNSQKLSKSTCRFLTVNFRGNKCGQSG
jgi:hypothetical protein